MLGGFADAGKRVGEIGKQSAADKQPETACRLLCFRRLFPPHAVFYEQCREREEEQGIARKTCGATIGVNVYAASATFAVGGNGKQSQPNALEREWGIDADGVRRCAAIVLSDYDGAGVIVVVFMKGFETNVERQVFHAFCVSVIGIKVGGGVLSQVEASAFSGEVCECSPGQDECECQMCSPDGGASPFSRQGDEPGGCGDNPESDEPRRMIDALQSMCRAHVALDECGNGHGDCEKNDYDERESAEGFE